MQTKLFIDGQFVVGAGAEEEILNPATGALIAKIPSASKEQIDQAVAAATRAFKTWGRTTPAERSGMLLKLADRIEAEAEAFAKLESLNCGKPYPRALEDEIPAIADCFRFFAGAARCMSGSAAGEYLAGYTSMIRRDPVGVVASIAPWNYPLMMVAWKIAPALAAGNVVVLKPSEQTPLTALKLAEIMADIFPAGVWNLVLGRGENVGAPLVSHPGVHMTSLTGDIATGRKVLEAATGTLKRTHLELGGKAPVIVFDDADIASVVENDDGRLRGIRCASKYGRSLSTLRPVAMSPVYGRRMRNERRAEPSRRTVPGRRPGKISAMISASFNAVSGVCSEGFSTTTLPAASAGASRRPSSMDSSQGAIEATTPTGSRRIMSV